MVNKEWRAMRVEDRVLVLEDRVEGLEARLRVLESTDEPPAPAPRVMTFPLRPSLPRLPHRPRRSAPRRLELDDLLGGRVLAWVGGVAVLVGVALLLGI